MTINVQMNMNETAPEEIKNKQTNKCIRGEESKCVHVVVAGEVSLTVLGKSLQTWRKKRPQVRSFTIWEKQECH